MVKTKFKQVLTEKEIEEYASFVFEYLTYMSGAISLIDLKEAIEYATDESLGFIEGWETHKEVYQRVQSKFEDYLKECEDEAEGEARYNAMLEYYERMGEDYE